MNIKNLEKFWDKEKVCKNPHKGWYMHYFDNSIGKYGNLLKLEDNLQDFPGMNHIYLRLAWSYLEPEEGKFTWEIIDRQIERWTNCGYTISFRITCKETGSSQTFATPEWVMKAGAKGTFIPCRNGGATWEPDYGDPIFLEKLNNFHKVFAARYDSKPWVEYVDIGSYGDWGEGHTAASSLKDWPVGVIKRHIDIHCEHYKNSLLVISDDIVGSREAEDGSKEEILQYLIDKGIALRDDGVSVSWFYDRFGLSTLRNPEMFDLFWTRKPVDLELQHYHITLEDNTWDHGVPFTAAIEESHATYIGFHGDARKFLAENPELVKKLANKAGYWYFIKSIEIRDRIKGGSTADVKLVWENHGVAPAYQKYEPVIMLEHAENGYQQLFYPRESDNKRWMPGRIVGETYKLDIPAGLQSGGYKVRVALVERQKDKTKFLDLGFRDSIKGNDGFYSIADIILE